MKLKEVFVASLFALVILGSGMLWLGEGAFFPGGLTILVDRKSTRLNSSHSSVSRMPSSA